MKRILATTLCLTSILFLQACTDPDKAMLKTMTVSMNDYLTHRGELCLAKYDWPIDVTPSEIAAGARNAVQMPVMEKLGLVSGSDVMVDFKTEDKTEKLKVRRYALTEEGQKYYLVKATGLAATGVKPLHPKDLCVARLSLDKIVAWEPPTKVDQHQETVVTYTYKIEAAPWTHDAEALRVFPMVSRLIEGAGRMQLKEAFMLTANGWQAKDQPL